MLRLNFRAGMLLLLTGILLLTFGGLFTVWAQDDVIPLPGIHSASRGFSEIQQITQRSPVIGDTFGFDLSRDGSQLAIGATGRNSFTGSVYVYQKSAAGTWESPVLVSAADVSAGASFGYSVVLRGDTLIASATGTGWNGGKGVVYVFKRNSVGSWVQAQKIDPAVPDGSMFGADIRLDASGERMVIAGGEEGTAYIFRKDNDGVWHHEARLSVGNRVFSAAIYGETVLIGSFSDDAAGSVHVYRFNGTTWTAAGILSPDDSHSKDQFGGRVYLHDSYAFVLGDTDKTGAVYVFEEVGGNWVQRQKLVPFDGGVLDQFGISVAVEGDTLVIGSTRNAGLLGSAYIFGWNGTAWTQKAKIAAVGGQFGYASDLTTGELLVSAPGMNTNAGMVLFYRDIEFELLTDGGFESSAISWTIKNVTGDKVKCNKDGKIVARSGNCAWQFKGVEGENARLQQTMVSPQATDTLTLSGYVNAKGMVSSKIKVVVKYTDPATPKSKITVNVSSATGGAYVPLNSIQPELMTDVVSAVDKLKITVRNSGTSGKVFYDDLSLKAK